jgi:hypothetical protein
LGSGLGIGSGLGMGQSWDARGRTASADAAERRATEGELCARHGRQAGRQLVRGKGRGRGRGRGSKG